METQRAPLSDLSFFRFPEVTSGVVANILLLVVLLALTVLVTVALQSYLQRRGRLRRSRAQFDRSAGEQQRDPQTHAVLRRLMGIAQARDEFAFIHDARAFEEAVEHLVAEAEAADELEPIEALGRLRRTLHLNLMNAELELVSTRQLLQDLPVRVLAQIGDEKLDLYCALLRVDERYLLIDLPHEEEIFRLLESHPHVFLLYWREREGEAVFRLELEAIEQERSTVFRARHALRDPATQQRGDFRLSVGLQAEVKLLEPVGPRGPGAADRVRPAPGSARVTDLSYGGASLLMSEAPPPHGLLQLAFDLQGKPIRLMLEVLSCGPAAESGWLVRGRFRGLGEEARGRLNAVLYREQIKRLRAKRLLHIRPAR